MTCHWWRLVHHPRSPKYNGRHSLLGYECACPLFCIHNVLEEKMGGCAHLGDAEYEPKSLVRSYAVKVEGSV